MRVVQNNRTKQARWEYITSNGLEGTLGLSEAEFFVEEGPEKITREYLNQCKAWKLDINLAHLQHFLAQGIVPHMLLIEELRRAEAAKSFSKFLSIVFVCVMFLVGLFALPWVYDFYSLYSDRNQITGTDASSFARRGDLAMSMYEVIPLEVFRNQAYEDYTEWQVLDGGAFLSPKEKAIYEKVLVIPSSQAVKNRDLYQQLVDLNPLSRRYQDKLSEYHAKAAKEIALETVTKRLSECDKAYDSYESSHTNYSSPQLHYDKDTGFFSERVKETTRKFTINLRMESHLFTKNCRNDSRSACKPYRQCVSELMHQAEAKAPFDKLKEMTYEEVAKLIRDVKIKRGLLGATVMSSRVWSDGRKYQHILNVGSACNAKSSTYSGYELGASIYSHIPEIATLEEAFKLGHKAVPDGVDCRCVVADHLGYPNYHSGLGKCVGDRML